MSSKEQAFKASQLMFSENTNDSELYKKKSSWQNTVC